MQKAKLDILENIPDIEMIGERIEIEEVFKTPPISGKQWAGNKLILIISILGLVVLVIAGGVWFYLTESVFLKNKEKVVVAEGDNFGRQNEDASKAADSETESGNISVPVAPPADKVITIYYKDFIIDLKDTSGRSKILVCDVAIDIIENENAAKLVNSKDVRKIIYRAAKGKSAVALRSLEERKRLKNEMAKELEKMLGEGVIKNVYFINYIIM
jgi:flagellar basal body-associated protein FliL